MKLVYLEHLDFGRRRRMIYGLLAKQTPTEAREHPQLPHWDASWAHLERILGASSANLGRIALTLMPALCGTAT